MTELVWMIHGSPLQKFLYVTLKAHTVVSEYMKLSKKFIQVFHQMKIVCYAQPSSDSPELISRILGVESMQRVDQSNISKMDTKLKKLELWKGESDKLLKKLK